MVYDAAIKRIVMSGGMSIEPDHPALNDMWAWDGTDWSPFPAPPWTDLMTPGAPMAYAPDGAVILVSGEETWAWHGSVWVKLDAITPTCIWCELTYDPVRKLTVLVTNTAGHPLAVNEVWVWDATRWSRRS